MTLEPDWQTADGSIRLYRGDCLEVMPELTDTVDAVVTSPPYAMQRAKQYGGIPEAVYPCWTLEWMQEARRILSPKGSTLINIREHIHDGEMSDYVHRTRMMLRSDRWIECEELIWIKPTPMPVGHASRPRRSWERLLWFAPSRTPFHNSYANGQASTRNRWSGDATEWSGKSPRKEGGGVSRCRDVATIPTSNETTGHPAAFPVALAEWGMNLICPPAGLVIDPFGGSMSTAIACINTSRRFIGIERDEHYFDVAVNRCKEALGTVGLFASTVAS